MKKVGEISMLEIEAGRYEAVVGNKIIEGNRALEGIKKSGVLVGLSFETIMYLPHKYNPATLCIEIFEDNFLVGGLDPAIGSFNKIKE